MAESSKSVSRRRSSARAAVDRRGILTAAIHLVDAEGLEALSMRKLGARLGVEAMTLYYYIPSKAELVQGIAEGVLDEMDVPVMLAGDWRAAVRALARAFRELGLRHPNVFPILASVGLDNPASYRPTEAILKTLLDAGFSAELAFTAFAAAKSYVVGHTLWLLGDQVVGSGGGDAAIDPELSAGYPTVTRLLPYIARCEPDTEFERGLDVLIAGLEALQLQREVQAAEVPGGGERRG